jgi:hypothetical protein
LLEEGVDPHPLRPVNFAPQVSAQILPAQDNNDAAWEENNWNNNNQQVGMQEELLENNLNAQDNDMQSSVTQTISVYAGENSTNLQQLQQPANDEVN